MQRFKTTEAFALDVRGHGEGVGAMHLSGTDVIPGALLKLTLFPICPVFQANRTSLTNHICWIRGAKLPRSLVITLNH